MPTTPPKLLERYANVPLCLADWHTALGDHFDTLRPLLSEVIGKVTTTYPTSVSGIRYDVATRGDRYMGYVPGDYEVTGIDDRWFATDELQLWQLDANKVAAFLGPVHAPHLADKPVVKVFNDFHSITLPTGRSVVFGRKYKRRAFLREAVAWCRKHQTDVIPAEQIIEDYNQSLAANQQKRAISTSRLVADLFKGQRSEFLELFEPVNTGKAIYRLRVTFELGSAGK